MKDNEKFTYLDSKNVEHSVELSPKDFTFVQENVVITDKAMKTKPTTFFKDALRRFAKNKSSVAGAAILGTLLVLTVFLPVFMQSDIEGVHPYEKFLAPKLFEAGTGWWDGTRDHHDIVVDFDWDHYAATGEYVGFPAGDFLPRAILGGQEGVHMSKVGERKTNAYSAYAHGGYIRYAIPFGSRNDVDLESPSTTFYLDYYNYKFSVNASPLEGMEIEGDPANYGVYFLAQDIATKEVTAEYELRGFTTTAEPFTITLNDNAELMAAAGGSTGLYGQLAVRLKIPTGEREADLLIKTMEISVEKGVSEPSEGIKKWCQEASVKDANAFFARTPKDNPTSYWTRLSPAATNVHQADIVYSSFRYDTYAVPYGIQTKPVADTAIRGYMNNDWVRSSTGDTVDGVLKKLANASRSKRQQIADEFLETLSLTEAGKANCPMLIDDEHPMTIKPDGAGDLVSFTVTASVYGYRWLGYSKAPIYLMGTDTSGRDLVHYAFAGLRTSLLIGVLSAIVCFSFGLVWGAISGYFGGWVDIAMERFCEILGGLPWIVLMTFMMLKFGQNLGVFFAAIILTGWMGTAGLTRTQFYRFKDREYILAARTLGAKDPRLIFRHILPNAVGTIITSAVLMIPSTIFSEASIAYMGLGLKGVSSFGVMLADNQAHIDLYPNLILFPSAIMALMMISFNLFGNGLRDAFNPSLKGQE